jgi:hypothetical protein
MVRNYKSNDKAFVPQTQHPKRAIRRKKRPPPKPSALLDFDLVPINNNITYRCPSIPEYINISDLYIIFKLFFIDKLLDKLAEFINLNAEIYLTSLKH